MLLFIAIASCLCLSTPFLEGVVVNNATELETQIRAANNSGTATLIEFGPASIAL